MTRLPSDKSLPKLRLPQPRAKKRAANLPDSPLCSIERKARHRVAPAKGQRQKKYKTVFFYLQYHSHLVMMTKIRCTPILPLFLPDDRTLRSESIRLLIMDFHQGKPMQDIHVLLQSRLLNRTGYRDETMPTYWQVWHLTYYKIN